MIKQLIDKIFKFKDDQSASTAYTSQSGSGALAAATSILAKTHKIDPKRISNAALKTTDSLQRAGYQAFIVGGAVRDLLLNQRPKDFDVATNATPEEVKAVFKRARIIGKRFRLVHVMFGNELIEVSTFRGNHNQESEQQAKITETGRILRDNVFGTIEEDALRRDFTVNALYYDPASQTVYDFHDGYADVSSGTLSMIGDPVTRYKEDPVRMLRAVRLSAKLGLAIAPKTEKPIAKLVDLLEDVPPSRLFDEMLKLFLSGHAIESVNALREQHLHHGLLPLLDVVLEQPMGERFVMLALENTDKRILSGKSTNPSFLFASLLWHEVLSAWQGYQQQMHLIPALHEAMNEVIAIQGEKLAIHNRYIGTMKEIWALQPRFEQRGGKRPFGLLNHPKFRAAYDFLLLRCASGELDNEIGDWWTQFSQADSETRQTMLLPDKSPKRRRRRPRKRNTSQSAQKKAS